MKFLELLCAIFIVLKLIGVIEWSWLLVLAPIWIPFIIILIVCIVCDIIE